MGNVIEGARAAAGADVRDHRAPDAVGERTLELFAESEAYNRVLWRRLARLSPPRGRVLEVGCGIGNLTALILAEPGVEAVHAIDREAAYVARVAVRFAGQPFTASTCALEAFRAPPHPEAAAASFDGIVSSNVLEHIEDDRGAMRRFAALLRPGGEALVLVPAHRWLFCDLDRNLSHWRRYRRRDLTELAAASGLELVRMRHFNPLGVLGWWLNGKVLRRQVLPARQLRAYSRHALGLSIVLDRLNPFPLGISLLGVFRRP